MVLDLCTAEEVEQRAERLAMKSESELSGWFGKQWSVPRLNVKRNRVVVIRFILPIDELVKF